MGSPPLSSRPPTPLTEAWIRPWVFPLPIADNQKQPDIEDQMPKLEGEEHFAAKLALPPLA